MTSKNVQQTDSSQAAVQASLFEEEVTLEELFEFDEADVAAEFLDYEEIPLLLVDTDPERAVRRQKEMMDYCFGGIGEEKKEEKRMGLAFQQLDIENRHALRLLLIYQEPEDLARHLERCLADPAYGYGERGDQGRTIAQAMAALSEEDDLTGIATAWLEAHRDFQQAVLGGTPLSFLSLFDYTDLDTFVPLLTRTGEMSWRLGIEGEGQYRNFEGPLAQIWPQIGDTYVSWCEADNEAWLVDLKRKAARLPDTILRAARADRLRKERERVVLDGQQVTLVTSRDGESWPRLITMADEQGVGQLGLSRLSGHGFFELAWEGGLHVRRFELSGTTRNRVPFEHIEIALLLAEALGAQYSLQAEPVTAGEVEAAYLRRMKVKSATLGPPAPTVELPTGMVGQPAATYKVNGIVATMLIGGEDFAYVAKQGPEDQAIVLRRSEKRGVIMALPVRRGRVRQGSPLMTPPLAELEDSPAWRRALCAWGAWLVWVLMK